MIYKSKESKHRIKEVLQETIGIKQAYKVLIVLETNDSYKEKK